MLACPPQTSPRRRASAISYSHCPRSDTNHHMFFISIIFPFTGCECWQQDFRIKTLTAATAKSCVLLTFETDCWLLFQGDGASERNRASSTSLDHITPRGFLHSDAEWSVNLSVECKGREDGGWGARPAFPPSYTHRWASGCRRPSALTSERRSAQSRGSGLRFLVKAQFMLSTVPITLLDI